VVRVIGGVDEAGRGPSLGPLIVCGVTFPEDVLSELTSKGVKDSKLLSPYRRMELVSFMQKKAKQIVFRDISASAIDAFRRQRVSLNEIEYRIFEDILGILKADITYLDCPDVDPNRLGLRLKHSCVSKELIVAHKADVQYIACSAASIFAKVRRDGIVKKLDKNFGPLGTGYLNDPVTQNFLRTWIKSHDSFPEFVRSTWKPCQNLLAKKKATSLTDFLSDE